MSDSTPTNQAVETGTRQVPVLGVVAILLGILALLAPGITGVSITMLLGILVIFGGVARLFWAFQSRGAARGVLAIAIALLTLLGGAVLLLNPVLGSGVVVVVLGVYFIVDGLAELAQGWYRRSIPGWGWWVFAGLVSVVLGILLLAQFPLSGARALGTLMGIKLIFVGILIATCGAGLRPGAVGDAC